MNDISRNIKLVLAVFLLCFIGLISYITYFQIFKSDQLVKSPYNRRIQAKRNEVLRGTIYDKNMKALTESKRKNTLNQKRTYTGGEAFAHILGYVHPQYGITGLEKEYDSVLTGTDTMDFKKFLTSMKEQPKLGYNIRTTLDSKVQQKAFELLGDNKGSVVVLNPKSGEVLAMVSKPSFDPNNLQENWKQINSDKNIPLYNRAILGLYPPGSTFKVVTTVSALDNIKNVANRTFQDNGALVFNSKQSLKNYNGHVYGSLDLEGALVKSSNVVFGGLGIELGNSALRGTAEKFCFNNVIPSDGFLAKKSKFPNLKSYEKGNMAQSAIGQGEVLASPIQMALVASTIANDGVLMKPHLVSEVLNPSGDSVKKIKNEVVNTVTTVENAKLVKKYMKDTVSRGTAGAASVDSIAVCGKTGTADTGRSGEKPHSWFIGFAPYENPQVAVAVIVENGGVGGGISTEIAGKVIREALREK